ncbi:hypothetical protein GCM10009765_84640 [Fodinicola feengrottensis]|uniref:Uncharacterized protein n=1 Tax=Fodinicola feengrottensis TaxID=435914 RepID=A0ABN2JDZ7_9ACTN
MNPATATTRQDLVLDNPDSDRRKIEHLTTLHTTVMRLTKTCPTTNTRIRLMPDHLIRVGDLFQGLPTM